jgi:hypothetical protein
MAVRAKFYVHALSRQAWDPDALKVTLSVVTRGEENRDWAAATPSGTIEMMIKNSGAAAQFAEALGKEFDVLFTVAEPAAPKPTEVVAPL